MTDWHEWLFYLTVAFSVGGILAVMVNVLLVVW
jgi:hypothetical protein